MSGRRQPQRGWRGRSTCWAVHGQFAVELGAGRVPVPAELAWLVPIVNAGLVVAVAHLPSPSGARVSARPEQRPVGSRE